MGGGRGLHELAGSRSAGGGRNLRAYTSCMLDLLLRALTAFSMMSPSGTPLSLSTERMGRKKKGEIPRCATEGEFEGGVSSCLCGLPADVIVQGRQRKYGKYGLGICQPGAPGSCLISSKLSHTVFF